MKIKGTILKEKSIIVNQLVPSPKMQIRLNRINMMPEKVPDQNLQCELQLHVDIIDEENTNLASIKIAYIVVAILDEENNYEQTEFADRIFNVLQSMYIASANDLLRESPLPPLPMNILC